MDPFQSTRPFRLRLSKTRTASMARARGRYGLQGDGLVDGRCGAAEAVYAAASPSTIMGAHFRNRTHASDDLAHEVRWIDKRWVAGRPIPCPHQRLTRPPMRLSPCGSPA